MRLRSTGLGKAELEGKIVDVKRIDDIAEVITYLATKQSPRVLLLPAVALDPFYSSPLVNIIKLQKQSYHICSDKL